MFGDTSVLSDAKTGLTHTRIEAEVAHQLLRLAETADVADRRDDAGGNDGIDTGDRRPPTDLRIVNRFAGDVAIKVGKILGQPVDRSIGRSRGCGGRSWRACRREASAARARPGRAR